MPGFEDLFLPLPRSPTLARTEGQGPHATVQLGLGAALALMS